MQKLVEIIREAADQAEVGYRHDYSGRGMYGEKCIGITSGPQEIKEVVCAVMEQVIDNLYDAAMDGTPDEAFKQKQESYTMIKKLMNTRQDQMGRDTIVYWPELKDESPPEEDDEVDYVDEDDE